MARINPRTYALLLPLAVMLGACSHMPAPPPAPTPVASVDANGNPIPPRPHIFGRHAWDLQYGDAARQAQNQPQPQAPTHVAQPAPTPVVAPAVAMAPPPPPPPAPVPMTPPVAAPPPAPAPMVAEAPAPAVQAPIAQAPIAPAPVAPAPMVQAPPVQMAVAVPPPPVARPVAPVAVAKAEPAPTPDHPLAFWKHLTRPDAPPITGGYQNATDMKAVHAAADFAVRAATFYDLSSIYSAKIQVVAGTNYSLCLWVRQKEHEANPLHRRMVAATVFQGLDGHYELSAWQEVNICRAGS